MRSPLEEVTISDEIITKSNQYQAILDSLSRYNEQIEIINQKIEERKLSVDKFSLQNQKVSLECLKNTKLRYSSEKSELINRYNELLRNIKVSDKYSTPSNNCRVL